MLCLKGSSGISISSVVTAFLMASTAQELVYLIVPLSLEKSHTEQDQMNWEFALGQRYCSRLGTARCFADQSRYFSEMLKFSVIIFQTLSIFMFSRTVTRRSPHTCCFTQSTLTRVLFVEGIPLLKSSFASKHPLMNILLHSKTRVCVCDMMLSPYTCRSISSACDEVFPNQTKNFWFIRSSVNVVYRDEINHKRLHIYIFIYSQMQIHSCSGTNAFINFLSLVLRHEERDTILTMLTELC